METATSNWDADEDDISVDDNKVEVNCRKNKKKAVLLRNWTEDFNNKQEAAGIPLDIMGMRQA